jgi:hypothetical protein
VDRTYSNTAYQVPTQFPSVFREDGPSFVEFVKTYYEWVEREGPGYKARRLQRYDDVDDTETEYLQHFAYKYLSGIPSVVARDRRFLVKHVLDVYRAKGSEEGLRLLFRLLYGEEIDVYVPSKDMLRSSDGKWNIPRYLEVTSVGDMSLYDQSYVTGGDSGATAIVEYYVRRNVNGKQVHLLYLSNIIGDFQVSEPVMRVGQALEQAARIIGSVVNLAITASVSGRSIGDYFVPLGNTQGIELKARVTSAETLRIPELTISLFGGGFGYTLDSYVDIIAGAVITQDGAYLLKTENSEYLDIGEGSGAGFTVSEISNTSTFSFSAVPLYVYEPDGLDANTFSYKSAILTESFELIDSADYEGLIEEYAAGPVINDNTVISVWASERSLNVGTITAISVTSTGSDYVSIPTIVVEQPIVYSYLIPDGAGSYWGIDADVRGEVAFGSNYVTSLKVTDSGFSYGDGETLTMGVFSDDDLLTMGDEVIQDYDGVAIGYGQVDDAEIEVITIRGAVGVSTGYWSGTDGMLNRDKYLQDSFYYQEYSYDVRSSMSLDAYETAVLAAVHPVGSQLFGTPIVGGSVDLDVTPTVYVEIS